MHEIAKLEEAEYFYGQMVSTVADLKVFGFNLSAFLCAARSVVQYAYKEATAKNGGQHWYDTVVSNRRTVAFFRKIRNLTIHEGPPRMSKSVTVYAPPAVAVVDQDTLKKLAARHNLIVSTTPSAAPQPSQAPPPPSRTEDRYEFLDWEGTEDALLLCQRYLSELRALVAEGIEKGYISG